MSLTFTQKHDDLMCVLAIGALISIAVIGITMLEEWNDQQYFKTLDKLTCEQIWELMNTQGTDRDTTKYFGERCNR